VLISTYADPLLQSQAGPSATPATGDDDEEDHEDGEEAGTGKKRRAAPGHGVRLTSQCLTSGRMPLIAAERHRAVEEAEYEPNDKKRRTSYSTKLATILHNVRHASSSVSHSWKVSRYSSSSERRAPSSFFMQPCTSMLGLARPTTLMCCRPDASVPVIHSTEASVDSHVSEQLNKARSATYFKDFNDRPIEPYLNPQTLIQDAHVKIQTSLGLYQFKWRKDHGLKVQHRIKAAASMQATAELAAKDAEIARLKELLARAS
jgi:hypothetical protein